MNIKGQNLRIFVQGKCVAAALNATIHASVNIQDSTTKDSPSGWDEYEVTGKTLEVTEDAVVQLEDVRNFSLNGNTRIIISGSEYFADSEILHLGIGYKIDIDCTDEYGIVLINREKDGIVARSDYGQPLSYTSNKDQNVYIATYGQTKSPCHVSVKSNGYTTQDFIDLLKNSSSVYISLYMTDGHSNRIASGNPKLSCLAVVTDANISSENKQRSTYKVTLKAQGEVTITSPYGQVMMLSLDDEEGQDISE